MKRGVFLSSIRNTRAVWPFCAVLMLWGKTEMVYWAEFHLEAGSLLQTCVLLINPAAFLLIVFGLSFLFKEEKKQIRFCLAAGVALSVVLYANILFFRFFSDYLTLPVLFQTSNFSDLKVR